MATDQEVLASLVIKAEEHILRAAKAQRRANEWAEECDLLVPFPNIETEQARSGAGRLNVRPDQFATYSAPSGAARAYLELRGKDVGATTLEDVYEALARGGFGFSSSNPEDARNGLRVALGKDRSFYRLPNGAYGLSEWYGRRKEKEEEEAAKLEKTTAEKKSDKKPKADDEAKVA